MPTTVRESPPPSSTMTASNLSSSPSASIALMSRSGTPSGPKRKQGSHPLLIVPELDFRFLAKVHGQSMVIAHHKVVLRIILNDLLDPFLEGLVEAQEQGPHPRTSQLLGLWPRRGLSCPSPPPRRSPPTSALGHEIEQLALHVGQAAEALLRSSSTCLHKTGRIPNFGPRGRANAIHLGRPQRRMGIPSPAIENALDGTLQVLAHRIIEQKVPSYRHGDGNPS